MSYHDPATGTPVPFLDPDDEELAQSATGFGAMALVVCPEGIILHLRDDKPWIPHPDCWSLFGGAVEPDETYAEAMARELQEELGLRHAEYRPLWRVVDRGGDERLLTIFEVRTPLGPRDLTLNEGQGLSAFMLEEALDLRLAPFCRRVLTRYAAQHRTAGQDVGKSPAVEGRPAPDGRP